MCLECICGDGIFQRSLLCYEPSSFIEEVTAAVISGTFMYRPISLQKVRFEENLEEVSCQTLNSVIYGEDVDLFPILDIRAGMDTVLKHTWTGTSASFPSF